MGDIIWSIFEFFFIGIMFCLILAWGLIWIISIFTGSISFFSTITAVNLHAGKRAFSDKNKKLK